MEGRATIKAALSCFAFTLLFVVVPAAAGDYFHSCADASGEFVINDGVLRTQRSAGSGEQPEIEFKETRRITIRREEGRCFSKSCKQSFGFETESYLLFAEFKHEDRPHRITFICELAASGLPAACDCDEASITYRRNLDPAFTAKGKPRKDR